MRGKKYFLTSSQQTHQVFCSSSGFPCVGVRLVYSSLRCAATFVIRFHWSLLLAFSLHFSSSSAFLRSLFTQSSHLSCGLPRFLQPSCFIVSDLFGKLESLKKSMLCDAIYEFTISLHRFMCQLAYKFISYTITGCTTYCDRG